MNQPAPSEEVITIDTSQLAHARQVASDHSVEVHELPQMGFEPVTTVTLVLIGGAAAVGAVVHILEQRKGGQVVDLRKGATKQVYRTPDVVYGTVVILTNDGGATVEVREPQGLLAQVVAKLVELATGGAEPTAVEAITTLVREFGDTVRAKETPGASR